MGTARRLAVARKAEQAALEHLVSRGLILIDRNYRCRFGEIDLVMRDGAVLVFVEVRYRKASRFPSAAESVDWRKQQKLTRTAAVFLARHKQYHDAPVRFDVVAFDGSSPRHFTLQWLRDAFRPIGRGN